MIQKKQTLIIMISLPLVMALVIFMVNKMRFEIRLTPEEQRLLNVSDQNNTRIINRKTPVVITAAELPIQPEKASVPEKGYPGIPLASVSPPVPGTGAAKAGSVAANSVSLIIFNSDRRMAIIDGKVVHEGDSVGQNRVAQIKEGKVLLQGRKGKTWLSLQ